MTPEQKLAVDRLRRFSAARGHPQPMTILTTIWKSAAHLVVDIDTVLAMLPKEASRQRRSEPSSGLSMSFSLSHRP